jgi:5'-methylthioadenosine phosphorylase
MAARAMEKRLSEWTLGVIGGSGLYDLEGLRDQRWVRVESPWGRPSDAVLTGEIEGVRLVFLPRHGRGHPTPPTQLNARANIDILKRAGCTDIVSFSAVGSLREDLAPGDFVVVDQYIDRTFARAKSFFEEGFAAHVSMAHPVCARLSKMALEAGRRGEGRITAGGTYLAMEGPQFSSLAESKLYRSWGCDVIGMTNMPEAKLAREAELPYASVCMVTDYDCWREETAHVETTDILAVLHANAARARALLVELARDMRGERAASPIDTVLDGAVITDPSAWDPALVAKLDAVCGRFFRTRNAL